MFHSWWPHELQQARLLSPPLSSRVCSNSPPLSQWCYPDHFILCRPLLLLLSIFPSIRVFSNESALHVRRPKHWSFSFSKSPSNEYSGLISLRNDWFDLLVVQGTLKSLLQHHSPKASILGRSAFLMVELSHPYMTTEKTIALTIVPLLASDVSAFYHFSWYHQCMFSSFHLFIPSEGEYGLEVGSFCELFDISYES